MRKLISFITLSLFVITTMASAQTAMPQSAIPAAGINSKVGVAAGVKGSVQLARNGGVGTVVSSGAEIFLGDKISTDAKGGLQILLLDQTTFTIGANSAVVVDQFVYDPTTDAGKVSVRVVEGTFRFITGKIAHKNPENMQVDLPNGTIGVRGTMVMGSVSGTKSLAILTGPGDKNNTGSKHGAIIVGGKGGDSSKSVRIAKTGFGTEIEGNGAPKMPFQVPQNILNTMTSELSPPNDDSSAPGEKTSDFSNQQQFDSRGSATERAGQGRVDTGGHIFNFGHLPPPERVLPVPGGPLIPRTPIEDNRRITRVQELGIIPSGVSYFNVGGINTFNSAVTPAPTFGNINIRYRIDFGNRVVGGGDSFISGSDPTINNGQNYNFNINPLLFNQTQGGGDNAIYVHSTTPHAGNLCAGCSVSVKSTLNNGGGFIAQNADFHVEVSNMSATVTVHGDANNVPRT